MCALLGSQRKLRICFGSGADRRSRRSGSQVRVGLPDLYDPPIALMRGFPRVAGRYRYHFPAYVRSNGTVRLRAASPAAQGREPVFGVLGYRILAAGGRRAGGRAPAPAAGGGAGGGGGE